MKQANSLFESLKQDRLSLERLHKRIGFPSQKPQQKLLCGGDNFEVSVLPVALYFYSNLIKMSLLDALYRVDASVSVTMAAGLGGRTP